MSKRKNGKVVTNVLARVDVAQIAKDIALLLTATAVEADKSVKTAWVRAVQEIPGDAAGSFLDQLADNLPEASRKQRKSEFKLAMDAAAAFGTGRICAVIHAPVGLERVKSTLRNLRDVPEAERGNVTGHLQGKLSLEDIDTVCRNAGVGDRKQATRPLSEKGLASMVETLARANVAQCQALVDACNARIADIEAEAYAEAKKLVAKVDARMARQDKKNKGQRAPVKPAALEAVQEEVAA